MTKRFAWAPQFLPSRSLAMLAGCAAPMSAAAPRSAKGKANLGLCALRAQMALAANDYASAVSLAEQAVESQPAATLGFRGLARQCLFRGGRFASAEAAYSDCAVARAEPAAGHPEAALWSQIAQGKNDEANCASRSLPRACSIRPTTVSRWRLPAVRTKRSQVLEPAARAQGADARVRQNLALAYALSPATGPRRARSPPRTFRAD